jgi:DNA mismatch repair protein MutL
MPTIRILPDQVANRIAAGEVIERPVAVVKELVDNSIDAQASRVHVEFQQGGKSQILVQDDGSGMSRDDALLCIERHATSKIRSSDDLFNIRTLGFRGEAIPSIASVSRFQMFTRTASCSEGTEILINGGKLIHCKAAGVPVGTRIEVTQLFNSIPARRKFLKTDNTEASHIIQWMRLMAIAHPHVAMRLQSGSRTLMNLAANDSLEERILSLWGRELKDQITPFAFSREGMVAEGFIGKPGLSRPSRQDIVTIVNGRPVESRTLGFAFTEAYHTLIPKGRYPLVFIRMDVEPALIDVNIHPSKKEIKFRNEGVVRTEVIQGVWGVLRPRNHPVSPPVFPSLPPNPSGSGLPTPADAVPREPTGMGPRPVAVSLSPASPTVATAAFRGPNPTPATSSPAHFASIPHPDRTSACNRVPLTQAVLERDWRFIGDYSRVYGLYERNQSLTLLHHGRANFRIQFERFRSLLDSMEIATQAEILPQAFELDYLSSRKLETLQPLLQLCKIGISAFGKQCFRLESVPVFLDRDLAMPLILDWVKADPPITDVDSMKNALSLRGSAARARAGNYPLSRESSYSLLGELLVCQDPSVDPEGKATMLHLPHRIIEAGGSDLGRGLF